MNEYLLTFCTLLILTQTVSCRPFLDTLLPNIFQFGPTTPESHISDYHNQPRTHLNADDPLTDQAGKPQSPSGSLTNINKPVIGENAILNPQIIGSILNFGRALFTNAVGNLFAVGQASPTMSPKETQAMERSTKIFELATMPTVTEPTMTPNAADDNNSDDETSSAAKLIVMEPTAAPLASLMQKETGSDAFKKRRSELKLAKAQRRVGIIKLEAIKHDDDAQTPPIAGSKAPAKNVNEENNAGLILVEAVSNGNEDKVSSASNDSTEIIDAFFDLNADDIFYYGNSTIQRPRLFPLIISSLLKYRNQTEQGLLNDASVKERHRVRLLYTLRPLVGVLRRKAENSKLRGQLRAMEAWLEQLQLNETQTIPLPDAVKRMRRQLSSILNPTQSENTIHKKRIKRSIENKSKRQLNDDKMGGVNQKVFDTNNFQVESNKIDKSGIDNYGTTGDVTRDNDTSTNEIGFDDDERDDNDDADDDDEVDDDDKSNMEIGETFSILILELIGTIAGLAYGAFNQLSHFIENMQN